MIRKEEFRQWAESKFWSDRGAAVGAYMDAMDSFCSDARMTKEQRCDFEVVRSPFWEKGGLDMAYQEYLERDSWERSHLGTALRINKKIGSHCAIAYCQYNDNYHRFGRPLYERLYERVSRETA